MSKCKLCDSDLDSELHIDCGGDCLMCIAMLGDPDCRASVKEAIGKAFDEGRLVFLIGNSSDDASSIFKAVAHETFGVTPYLLGIA